MMVSYLGEKPVVIESTRYKNFTPSDWAKLWIERYAQNDGANHKMHCLDTVMRILHGTPMVVTLASWDDGRSEYRYRLGEPSESYQKFVDEYEADGEYSWETGCAP